MGKQRRRRRNDKRGGPLQRGGKGHDNNNLAASVSPKVSTVLARIRHGDPRVRYGALSALAVTVFASGSKTTSSSKDNSQELAPDALIRAITERIAVDEDVPSAKAAAGCLLNYAEEEEHCERLLQHVPHVDVVGILLARIARCTSRPVSSSHVGGGQGQGRKGRRQQQQVSKKKRPGGPGPSNADANASISTSTEWEVTSTCLDTLCTLVECDSESAKVCVDRLSQGDGLIALLHALTQSHAALLHTQQQQTNNNTNNASAVGLGATRVEACKESAHQALIDSLTSSCRILHGAMEANTALAHQLFAAPGYPVTQTGLQALLQVVKDDTLAAKPRLHAAGALITLRHLLTATTASSNTTDTQAAQQQTQMEQILQQTLLPTLSSFLTFSPTHISTLAHTLATTAQQLQKELVDEAVEREVQTMIEQRQEPARQIARRLKKQSDEAAAAAAAKKDQEGAPSTSAAAAGTTEGAMRINDCENSSSGGGDTPMMETDDDTIASSSTDKKIITTDKQQPQTQTMEEEEDTTNNTSTKNDDSTPTLQTQAEQHARDAYEQAMHQWKTQTIPLQLALEIVANLAAGSTSAAAAVAAQAAAAEDEDGWGSEDEDRMECMAQSMDDVRMEEQEEDGGAGEKLDRVLFEGVSRSELPEKVLVLLSVLCTPLLLPSTPSEETQKKLDDGNDKDMQGVEQTPEKSEDNQDPQPQHQHQHPVVVRDMAELQSKCAACLGNMMGNFTTWRNTDTVTEQVWRVLCKLVKEQVQEGTKVASTMDMDTKEDNQNHQIRELQQEGMVGLTGAMLAILQAEARRKLLLPRINETDVSFLLSLLGFDSNDDTKKVSACSPVEARQHAVLMLGTLCTTTTTTTTETAQSIIVNRKICKALLQSMTHDPSIPVVVEVLNVIMDVYGDETKTDVFKVFVEERVLEALKRMVPLVRKRIKEEEKEKRSGEEVEGWKETVLNASRFIRYMEGHVK